MADVNSPSPNKQFPKDGLVIISMMKELGITSYEPRVVNQLLEFTIRYVSCVLDDARAFANHSKKKAIDNDDVKLAVMMQLERVFTTPPPRDLLLEVARTKNNIPLPLVKPHCGIRLPPDRYCFSSCNYKLKSNSSTKKAAETKPQPKFGVSTSNLSNAVNIKVSKPVSSSSTPSSTPTVGIKRPPNITAVARTQPSVTPGKPIIKLTTSPMMVNTNTGQILVNPSASGQVMAKARIVAGPQAGQQVEVKIEPQDSSLLGKRKREDGE
ncbi:unnamed protein product [Nezara viridula]|uniref:Transcription initiation factor TFIID subunit 9 n=1 Tax=Nezara viridula TaxID=85310 RepID=A0A9P0HC01_NEZVI|nr:unnamed protein product [Nezara viridula]